MIFPWQQREWQSLWQTKSADRLPHALLLTGMTGIGKMHFAECFARALLCSQATKWAEGSFNCDCHSCKIMIGRTHPNIMWVEPEKPGAAIKVDSIREVSEFVSQSSLQGNYRFVIINSAHQMNINAANALLKTLEEPSSGAMLLLVSDQSKPLPATILSRCQRLLFARPQKMQSITWLNAELAKLSAKKTANVNALLLLSLANGAPLAALQYVQEDFLSTRCEFYDSLIALRLQNAEPLKSAAALPEDELPRLLQLLLSFLMDLIYLQVQGEAESIVNIDYQASLTKLAINTPLKSNLALMDYLQVLRKQMSLGVNFNKLLMLENILIRWTGRHAHEQTVSS